MLGNLGALAKTHAVLVHRLDRSDEMAVLWCCCGAAVVTGFRSEVRELRKELRARERKAVDQVPDLCTRMHAHCLYS